MNREDINRSSFIYERKEEFQKLENDLKLIHFSFLANYNLTYELANIFQLFTNMSFFERTICNMFLLHLICECTFELDPIANIFHARSDEREREKESIYRNLAPGSQVLPTTVTYPVT